MSSSTPEHRVFISHSSNDKAIADRVCAALESQGIACWMAPRDIPAGTSWAGAIIDGINACSTMVLLFSQHSNSSDQVIREVDRASERGMRLITLKTDTTQPTREMEYFLCTVQWLDMSGGQAEQAIEELLAALDKPLERPAAREHRGAQPSRLRHLKWMLVPLAAVVIALAIGVFRGYSPAERGVTRPSGDEIYDATPVVAIPKFRNLSGTEGLDWLRDGLAEMVITDLSQASGFRVLSSEQLERMLGEESIAPESPADYRNVAQRTNATAILMGRFAQAGNAIEISIQLQDAATGKILVAHRESGIGEASVFELVDGLSRAVRKTLEPGDSATFDKDLRDVSTASPEAYRLYTEGLLLANRDKRQEAIPLLERSVEIDPDFSMAHARLAIVYENLGMSAQADASVEQAYRNIDRLPGKYRYYIEGLRYSRTWRTYALSLDAFRTALELDPGSAGLRYQLALLYGRGEFYEEAIGELVVLRKANNRYVGIEHSLANMYAARGEFEEGQRVLQTLLQKEPQNWMSHTVMGWHLTSWGKSEDALAAYDRASALRPGGSLFLQSGRWRARMLAHDWQAADAIAREQTTSDVPYAQWLGFKHLATTTMLRGNISEARALFAQAAATYSEPNAFTAMARQRSAWLSLEQNNYAQAIEESERAEREAPDSWPAWEALFVRALAEQGRGHADLADDIAASLGDLASKQPGAVGARLHTHLLGALALARGETATAIEQMATAAELLSEIGVVWDFQREPDHAPVWFDLGRAYLAGGQLELAKDMFTRVVERRLEHIYFPVQFVRSHRYLAQIAQQTGDDAGARRLGSQYADFWPDSGAAR